MKAINLRTDYLENPLGLGNTTPEFFWNCEGGTAQSAYHVVVKKEQAAGTHKIVWDSGEVESASMTHIGYEGEALQSRDRLLWEVSLCDENGVWGEAAGGSFEIGLLAAEDWRAKWITGDYRPKKNMRRPVDCFRRRFEVRRGLRSARLYVSACGLYEACVNGKRVGDYVLAPGCTDYRKRIQYQAYDVTALLENGSNSLEILLADGWYRGSIGCFGQTNVFGRQTKVLCQLETVFEDGSREIVGSDEGFAWSDDGSIRFADLKDGETVEAGRRPSYAGKARVIAEPVIPSAADNVAVTEHEHFKAKLTVTPSGRRVLDFGQNLAGFVAFTVHGKKGQRLHLTLGEILDEKGEFTQANMVERRPVKEFGKMTEIMLMTGNGKRIKGEMQNTPRQEIAFTCSGKEDFYKTKFAVFGFRYALVETEMEIDPEDFEAIAVYSDLRQTGNFTCSNGKINRLFHNTLWSMKSNFADVPTDCPTRERLGWTGDAQVFFRTGAYLMDTAPFFKKWLRDMRDNQLKNGKLSAVVPYNGLSMLYDNTGGSVGWADAAVLIPYRFWKAFGDKRVLEENYEMMRAYAMFMIGNTGHKDRKKAKENPFNKYTYEKGMHLGEWLEPEEFQDKIAAGHNTLHTEECTAYLHFTMKHMAEAAAALGKAEDAALFEEYARGAAGAYEYLFLRDGIPDTDRQAKLIRPLAFGIAEGETKSALEERLAKAVESRGYRIGTGFLSTPFVLGTLTGMGRPDLAYKMLENEEQPGWLYEVNCGATTVWENWEGTVSHNHYSPGAVCQWLFDTVAGIRTGGENRFCIQPVPGGTLTHAQAVYDSPYGRVESGWKKDADGGIVYTVVIPANTAADIMLPDGTCRRAGAGSHVFVQSGDPKRDARCWKSASGS